MVSPQLRVPELVPGIDVRSLPLSAVEGFVMSRIDGRSSAMEIVSLTGLGFELVSGVLDKLHQLGAVRFRDGTAATASVTKSVERSSQPQVERPFASPQPRNAQNPPARPPSSSQQQPVAGASPLRPPSSESRVPSGHRGPPSSEFRIPSGAPSASPSRPPSETRTLPPAGHGSEPPTGQRHIPPRKRASLQPPPRRMMSESGYSSPPPEMRSSSMRPPAESTHAASRTRPSPTHSTTHRGPSEPPEPERIGRPLMPAEEQKTQPRVIISVLPSEPSSAASGGPPSSSASAASDHVPPPSAQPQLYDPRELDEDVDLPRDRRKQLLDLFYRLSDLDYYELLGISYAADKKDVRAAYFALSKVYHPDSMFRKNLGSFKPKMEAVFKALTEAYDTLSKKKHREEYDAYLRATKATQMAEAALRREVELEAAAVVDVPPAPAVPLVPVVSEPPPAPPSAPARDVSPEARRLAQEVIARRLKGVSQFRPPEAPATPTIKPPPAPATSSTPPGPRTDPQELLRRLARTLKDVGQHTGTNDHVTRAIKASQTAFAKGDLTEAAQQMSKAVSLAPQREDLRVEYERISKMLSEKLANDYAAQAAFEQKSGKWASAALSWSKVCTGRPDDAHAHLSAANALLKAGGDLRGAQRYAQQAVFLAPDDIDARLLLAQIYMTIGLKLNARRELDAAAKLDPKHEMVKNLLADLKG